MRPIKLRTRGVLMDLLVFSQACWKLNTSNVRHTEMTGFKHPNHSFSLLLPGISSKRASGINALAEDRVSPPNGWGFQHSFLFSKLRSRAGDPLVGFLVEW